MFHVSSFLTSYTFFSSSIFSHVFKLLSIVVRTVKVYVGRLVGVSAAVAITVILVLFLVVMGCYAEVKKFS